MQAHMESRGEEPLIEGPVAAAAQVLRAAIFSLDVEWLDGQSRADRRVERQIHRQSRKFGARAAMRYLARLVEVGEDELDRADFFERVEAELGLAPGKARRLIEGREPDVSGRRQPLDEITGCMEGLRHLGLKVGLIVHGSEEVAGPRLRQLGVLARVDEIVFSGSDPELGPDPSLFARCLVALDESPGASVYVGSRWQADLLGANQAGLTTVWTRDRSGADPRAADVVIHDLRELEVWARARVESSVRAH